MGGRGPVVIGRYPTEFAAALARGALAEAGIPSEMAGVHTAGFRAEAPGMVSLLVPADLEEAARAVLEDFSAEPLEDDWDEDHGPDPA